jgi:hypothetical protein
LFSVLPTTISIGYSKNNSINVFDNSPQVNKSLRNW